MGEFNSASKGLRYYLHRLRVRIVEGVEKLLGISISSKEKPKIKILSNGSNETAERRKRRPTYSTIIRGAAGNSIRISHRDGPAHDGASTTVVAPTRSFGLSIIMTQGPQRCSACKGPLMSTDRTAQCSKNDKHVIHEICVALMRNKCPTCGEFIS